jgi:hypothetical protein
VRENKDTKIKGYTVGEKRKEKEKKKNNQQENSQE